MRKQNVVAKKEKLDKYMDIASLAGPKVGAKRFHSGRNCQRKINSRTLS